MFKIPNRKVRHISVDNGLFKNLFLIGINQKWIDTVDKAERYDREYKFHSGLKELSSIISDTIFEDDDITSVAYYIYDMYHLKWKSYWDALTRPYDILATDHKTTITDEDRKEIMQNILNSKEFANIVKEIARNETINKNERNEDNIDTKENTIATSKINDSIDKSSSKEDTSNSDRDTTEDLVNFVDENIYGFNSTAPSDADDTHTTERRETHDNTTNKNNVDTIERQNNTTENDSVVESNSGISSSNNKTNDEKVNETENSNNNIDRNKEESKESDNTIFKDVINKIHGREGVSPQSLIEEELELRKRLFLDIVFGDVDKLITIQVY